MLFSIGRSKSPEPSTFSRSEFLKYFGEGVSIRHFASGIRCSGGFLTLVSLLCNVWLTHSPTSTVLTHDASPHAHVPLAGTRFTVRTTSWSPSSRRLRHFLPVNGRTEFASRNRITGPFVDDNFILYFDGLTNFHSLLRMLPAMFISTAWHHQIFPAYLRLDFQYLACNKCFLE